MMMKYRERLQSAQCILLAIHKGRNMAHLEVGKAVYLLHAFIIVICGDTWEIHLPLMNIFIKNRRNELC